MRAIERRISSLEMILEGMDADLTDLGTAMDALGNFCADQARKLNDLEAAFRARVGGILHRWGRGGMNVQPPQLSPAHTEPPPFGPGAGASPDVLPPPSGLLESERNHEMMAFMRLGRPVPEFFASRTNF